MSRAVVGIVSDLVRAEHLVRRLTLAGFGNGRISVLGPDCPISHIRCEKHSRAAECALIGATAGGVLGAITLVNSTSLGLSSTAALFAAGTVVPLLCGLAVGVITGMSFGAIFGMFIPKYEAKQFSGLFAGGNILVSVHIDDKEQFKQVKALFEGADAEDISCVDECASPA